MIKRIITVACALLFPLQAAVAADRPHPLAAALASFKARDFPAAIRLAKPLADKDDPDARMLIGMAYFIGVEGGLEKSDFSKAAEQFYKARGRKHAEAAYAYSRLLEMGDAPQDEIEQAISVAATLGSPGAQESLATRLMTGPGPVIPRDDDQALVWLTRAASGGSPGSQMMLGQVWEKGRLSPKPDLIEAEKWLWLAANSPIVEGVDSPLSMSKWWRKRDSDEARRALAALEAKLTKDQIAEGRRRASNVGAPKAKASGTR